jgi:photosystem II stability/assembly factor-like uncharacterized protein
MFVANMGWALHAAYLSVDTADGKILRTANGIQTWNNVSPSIPDGYSSVPKVVFVDPITAIAIYTKSLMPKSPKTEITIQRTTDGGKRWQAGEPISLTQAPMMEISQVLMVDPKHGWMLGEGDGSMGKSSVIFFETQDGGMHWNVVYNTNDHVRTNDPNTLWGFSNYPYGDRSFIFITTTKGFYSNGGLFLSQDGGKTWQVQQLPPPGDIPDLDAKTSQSELFPTVSVPQFFSAQDGVLIRRIYSRNQVSIPPSSYTGLPQAQYLYFTHDGGKTWVPNQTPAKIGEVFFRDTQIGWFLGKNDVDPSTITQLYQTIDGGKTWTQIVADSSLPLGSEIQFVDEKTGFAFNPPWAGPSYNEIDGRAGNTSSVFTTTDGGRTWNNVEPELAP